MFKLWEFPTFIQVALPIHRIFNFDNDVSLRFFTDKYKTHFNSFDQSTDAKNIPYALQICLFKHRLWSTKDKWNENIPTPTNAPISKIFISTSILNRKKYVWIWFEFGCFFSAFEYIINKRNFLWDYSLLVASYMIHILGNSFRSCYFLFVASPFWYCHQFHTDETRTKPEMKNQTNKLNFPWIKNDKKKNISHSWQFSITCIACIQFNLKDNYSIFCSICTAVHFLFIRQRKRERESSWFDFS